MAKRKEPAAGAAVPPAARRPGRATSYDVARLTGVSQSAVSRCFAPNASIAPATRERFGIIAGPEDSFVGEERRAAAQARLAEAGIRDVPLVRGDYGYASGREGLHRLAVEHDRPDAVICVNDMMAIGAIDAARAGLGLAVRDDISIVGFEGTAPASPCGG